MKEMKKILSLLLVLIMVFALAACSSSTDSEEDADSDAATEVEDAAEDSSEAKVLRVGLDGAPTSLDFNSLAGGNACQFVGWSTYGTLWKIMTDGEMVYMLAESYEESEDGLTTTIHLRDTGFSNGDPLTADDVLFSLRLSDEMMGDRTRAIDLDNSYAEDDKTLVLAMKQQTPTFIDDLGVISIVSQSWTEDYTNEDHIYNEPLACGPYYIESGWSSGSDMVLLKNEYYYNAENLAFDEIDVSFVEEETTRKLSFDSGEYDIVYLSESANVDEETAAEGVNVFTAPVQMVEALVFDTENENSPYTNQNLRLAVQNAVDVPAIVSSICGDAFTPATSFLPSTNWGWKDEGYTYDPDAAKEYVAAYTEETGDTEPTITLSIHEGNIDEGIAEAIQYYLSEVGITCVIDVMDFGTFFTAMLQNSMYCYITQYSGSEDPGSVMNSWIPESTYTMFDYPDDIADLINRGCFTAGTQEERTEILYQMQDALKEFGKGLPIYEGMISYAVAGDSIDISRSVQADGYLIPDLITVS